MAWTSSALQKRSFTAPKVFFSFSSRPQSLFTHNSTSCHLLFRKTPRFSSFVLSTPSPCCCVTRVSTAPVEYASPTESEFDFSIELARLRELRSQLSAARSLKEKHRRLDSDLRVKELFRSGSGTSFSRVLKLLNLDSSELFLLKCLVAAGQEHVLYPGEGKEEKHVRSSIKIALYALVDMIEGLDMNGGEALRNRKLCEIEDAKVGDLKKLLKTLQEIEQFYDCIGGIIGYQIKVLELIKESTLEIQSADWPQSMIVSGEPQYAIHSPNGVDLSCDTDYASQAALWGIEGLQDLGEIYPLGGSADRLGLVDDTGECLPAAMLPYCGRTLLEGLIRDLQAREFLYFKLYGRQCITPVAIMTSSAKKNHERITSLCVKLEWFGRGQSSFQLFEQPLVPAVSGENGQWLVTKQLEPVCKPGGHGVIWKLAHDKGVFEWFFRHGRKGATVRQVSNVVAATDVTLLALSGIGIHYEKKLGFASCKRNLAATEGINVLIEKKTPNETWSYGLSCIEYTEFDKFGIAEGSVSVNRLQAEFPANTNILYVDLRSAAQVASFKDERSLPGMVLNMKKPVVYVDQFGKRRSVTGGRLESTMQNIADNFSNTFSYPPYNAGEGDLDTFLVYNERRRVTSSAKKKRKHFDKSLHQTPEGSFLDIMRNAYDLLSYCNIKLPEIEGNDRYIESGPPFIVLLHPALGPLWEVTRQKFSGGYICKGSELKVEVAEFLWRGVQLDGSLIIEAENMMGSTRMGYNGEPILEYGLRCGRCRLENVKILNDGIDWTFRGNIYWKHDVRRLESLRIILHGNAEFEAKDVTIQGDHVFEVPNGHKLKIMPGISGFDVQLHRIAENGFESGSWHWNYKIKGTHIQLDLIET